MKLISRLRQRRRLSAGETLVESLCAILVCALSVMMLATLFTVSARMNRAADERNELFYGELNEAELQTGTPRDGTVSVTRTDGGGTEIWSYDVQYYGDQDSLISYILRR